MSVQDQIRELDARLLVSGERLSRYRKSGPGSSVIVQTGVCDRLLDERLDLMRERDKDS